MKRYKGLVKTGFKIALAYRFDFFAQLFTSPVSLIVFYFLWKSIYSYSGQEIIQGFTFDQMVTYYFLNFIVAFFTWSKIDRWMEHDIRFGHMIMDLLRPLEHFFSSFLFELGLNILGIIIQAIPFFIIGVFFFNVEIASWLNIAFFVLSILLANALFFIISYIIGLSAFWLKRIEGLSRAKKPIIHFFSGGLIPLTFMPLSIQNISHYLPFQYIRYIPISIYLGKFSTFEIVELLGIQIVWVISLAFLVKIIWNRAFRKFAGAGA